MVRPDGRMIATPSQRRLDRRLPCMDSMRWRHPILRRRIGGYSGTGVTATHTRQNSDCPALCGASEWEVLSAGRASDPLDHAGNRTRPLLVSGLRRSSSLGCSRTTRTETDRFRARVPIGIRVFRSDVAVRPATRAPRPACPWSGSARQCGPASRRSISRRKLLVRTRGRHPARLVRGFEQSASTRGEGLPDPQFSHQGPDGLRSPARSGDESNLGRFPSDRRKRGRPLPLSRLLRLVACRPGRQ